MDDLQIEHVQIPVEGPDNETARDLYEELTPRLSEETERELAGQSLSEYHACLQDRAEWESRLAEWEAQ